MEGQVCSNGERGAQRIGGLDLPAAGSHHLILDFSAVADENGLVKLIEKLFHVWPPGLHDCQIVVEGGGHVVGFPARFVKLGVVALLHITAVFQRF